MDIKNTLSIKRKHEDDEINNLSTTIINRSLNHMKKTGINLEFSFSFYI